MIIAAQEARGKSLHEVSRASQQQKQFGVCFDGVARVLRHDPRRLWRVHLALRCPLRLGGARPRVVRVPTGHFLFHIFSLARPLWRFSRADLAELGTLARVVWLSECELGRPFSRVVFCSDATLRRYCVQCNPASFEELKEATRFRERWRFRTREVSRTLPVRYVDEVARLGTSSPLGCHSRHGLEEQDLSRSVAGFGRAAEFEEVSTRCGVWLDGQGLRTRRTSMRASSPKATWEPFAVSLQRGEALLAGTRSSKATSSSRRQST